MRTPFQQGLRRFAATVASHGRAAEQAVDRARQAYVEREPDPVPDGLEGEGLINTAEREIDEAAFDLLANAANRWQLTCDSFWRSPD